METPFDSSILTRLSAEQRMLNISRYLAEHARAEAHRNIRREISRHRRRSKKRGPLIPPICFYETGQVR